MNPYEDILHAKRPTSAHPKMPLSNRAKLFSSFDALRGFNLAILTKQVERELVARITLSEDAEKQIDQKLHWLEPGAQVTVTFFA